MDHELKSTALLLELSIRYIRYLITATQKQCAHWYFLLSLNCISALGYEGEYRHKEYRYKEENLSKLLGSIQHLTAKDHQ